MSGQGRAGEVTYADVKGRLKRVTVLLSEAETELETRAAALAASRAQAAESGGGSGE